MWQEEAKWNYARMKKKSHLRDTGRRPIDKGASSVNQRNKLPKSQMEVLTFNGHNYSPRNYLFAEKCSYYSIW